MDLPQGDLPTVHSRYTYRSSALPEGPLGGSSITKGSWIHLWTEDRQASRQLSDASTSGYAIMLTIKQTITPKGQKSSSQR